MAEEPTENAGATVKCWHGPHSKDMPWGWSKRLGKWAITCPECGRVYVHKHSDSIGPPIESRLKKCSS